MVNQVGSATLREMILDDGELAILDVREEGIFSRRHLLFACPAPLSRLELVISDLVPRRSARVVLCDDGDGLSERAAARLQELGYTDISVLRGGNDQWEADGNVLFSGVNVPSKAFGEFVEVNYHTPNISAEELKGRIDSGEDMVVLDSRPIDEYRRMNIPTGIDVPGAELAYRVHDIAPSPDTLVVVNCAGRTRSIIGAQSLINAGIPNRVMALTNGTMGWDLAGYELERGNDRRVLESSGSGIAKAKEAAARVAARFGVATIDRATLDQWMAERDDRSLYLFDVRNPEEYEAGHLPGSVWAPGGQLVQATDRYAATRNARIVLIDDTGVRATMTASWLIQLGWSEAVVLEGGLSGGGLETGARKPLVLGLDDAVAEAIEPQALNALLAEGGATVFDFALSPAYRAGHIQDARFAARARLKSMLDQTAGRLVFTCENGVVARLAAAEATGLTDAPVAYLAGGAAAWSAAGLPLVDGEAGMGDNPDDVVLKPYDRSGGVREAMNEYLSWEINLVSQIEADGTTRFRLFPA